MSKTLFITGGSRGIGAATARRAARAGYDVAITYVSNREAAESVRCDIEADGRRAVVIKADTGNPQDIARAFREFDAALGGMDAFFNNAGIFAATAKFVDIPLVRVQQMVAVNAVGPFLCAQEAIRRMSTRLGGKGGVIVNMSSIASKVGGSHGSIDYAMTKGGIDTLTVGLAKEVAAEGIRINAVRPGLIYTDIHASAGEPDRVDRIAPQIPLQRGGTADEVADAVLWLLSEQSSYVTGTLVDVTGGRGL